MLTDEERQLFAPLMSDPALLERVLGGDARSGGEPTAVSARAQSMPVAMAPDERPPLPEIAKPSPPMTFNATPSQPDTPLPTVTKLPQREAWPSESSRGATKAPAIGDVDPGLAFMAAFSQNPVLQKMVEESRNRPRVEAEAQRAQEKWQLERDLMSPLKAAKTRSEIGQSALNLADKDPASERSKSTREGVSRVLMMHATRMASVDQDMAKQMQQAASFVLGENVSAKQALDMATQFGGVGSLVAKDAQQAADRAQKEAYQKESLAQGWATRNETQRHNMATEANAANAMQLKILHPQEKLNKEISNLDFALSSMKEAAELKKDVNTGKYVQALANFTNEWIDSDLTSDKRKQLGAIIARVFNKERHEIAGSAVSPAEFAVIEPQIPSLSDDDSLFATKLAKAIQLTSDLLANRKEEYQRHANGLPVDMSNKARKATGQKPVLTPEEQGAKPQAGGSRFQVGQTATNKATGERVQWDGSKWVPVK